MGRSEAITAAAATGKPVLGYWRIRGLAQMTRLVLVQGGVEFEEVRYDLAEDEPWPGKPGSPWLQDKESLGLVRSLKLRICQCADR